MNRVNNFSPIVTLLALGLCSEAFAQESSAEDDELNQLLNLLDQQTSLATQTKLNADFVPGMFSVLSGEDMRRRGFRTLWEALAAVPGVLTVMNETGMRSISVRGVGETFEPSKVKLLLNGHAINASASATTGTIYDTPVDQIERVEFIRGPGSAIHGEFSFAGVLNVITRKQGEEYSAGIETGDGYRFSALKGFDNPGFEGSFSFAASQTNGEGIDSGADRSANPGHDPGPINNKRDFISAIVDLNFDELNALFQIQQANRGDHFGTNNVLPPDTRQTVVSDTVLSLALSQPFEFDDELSGKWSLSAVQNETEKNGLFLGVAQDFGGLPTEDDVVADSLLTEQRLEAKANLQRELTQHTLFAEISAVDIRVSESQQFINLDPFTLLPSPTLNEFPGPVNRDQDRSSVSLVLQDEFHIDDSLTLTSGLRWDDYRDIGSNLSPRIALVWRRTTNHIYKAQFARAFRPPSLIEVGGAIDSSIDPETNDTIEFGYIYHGSELVMRNTLYYSQLDNLIVFQDFAPIGFLNTSSQDLYGYELEIEKKIDNDWEFNANLSLQNYSGSGLPGAAPWMAKVGAQYAAGSLTTFNVELNSIGKRDRAVADPRSDFGQTNQVDVTLRRLNIADVDGLSLRWGIRNILDQDLKHASATDTYPNDYPYSDGAMLWAQLIYRP